MRPATAGAPGVVYCQCETPIMDPEHDAGCRRCGNPVDFTPAPQATETPQAVNGRHDAAMRRRSKRTGRERGCWLYIPAVDLEKAGYGPDQPAPFYRVWGNARGRITVQLYRAQ